MRLARTSTLVACFAVALTALPGAGRADATDAAARSTARKLAQEALKLYDAGKYEAALEKLNTADALVPAPTLGLYAARCLVKLGKLVEASERYLEVTRMQLDRFALPVMRRAKVDAVAERDKLLPTIPTLEVRVDGPAGDGVVVTVDDKVLLPALLGVKRPVNPGNHRAIAKRVDVEVTSAATVKLGESGQIVLALPPVPPKPVQRMPPLRVAGWVGLGLGVAGGVLGIVSGVISIAQQQSLVAECKLGKNLCPEAAAGKIATYNVVTKLTTVGLITGLAGLAFGIPIVIVTPKSEWVHPDGSPAPPPKDAPTVSIKPFVTLGGAGVSGVF